MGALIAPRVSQSLLGGDSQWRQKRAMRISNRRNHCDKYLSLLVSAPGLETRDHLIKSQMLKLAAAKKKLNNQNGGAVAAARPRRASGSLDDLATCSYGFSAVRRFMIAKPMQIIRTPTATRNTFPEKGLQSPSASRV
jgi:hypothetical protein